MEERLFETEKLSVPDGATQDPAEHVPPFRIARVDPIGQEEGHGPCMVRQDAVRSAFVGGPSGPQATPGVKILENVPCDTLPTVLEGLIRYLEPERLRRQLRTLSAAGAVVSSRGGSPRPRTDDAGRRPILMTDELREGSGKALVVNGREVAVFRCQGQLYALQNRCPHEGGSLAGGVIEADEVICPIHGYRFNVKTGACSTDPRLPAKTFAVVAEDGGFTVDA